MKASLNEIALGLRNHRDVAVLVLDETETDVLIGVRVSKQTMRENASVLLAVLEAIGG